MKIIPKNVIQTHSYRLYSGTLYNYSTIALHVQPNLLGPNLKEHLDTEPISTSRNHQQYINANGHLYSLYKLKFQSVARPVLSLPLPYQPVNNIQFRHDTVVPLLVVQEVYEQFYFLWRRAVIAIIMGSIPTHGNFFLALHCFACSWISRGKTFSSSLSAEF